MFFEHHRGRLLIFAQIHSLFVTLRVPLHASFNRTCRRRITWFLPARRYASAGNSDRNVSVRLCLCPSATRRYFVKMKKASVMISSPSGSFTILVCWCQISSQQGFPRAGTSNKGGVGKLNDFLALSVNISKTVADMTKVTVTDYNRKSHVSFRMTPRSMTLNDLKLL